MIQISTEQFPHDGEPASTLLSEGASWSAGWDIADNFIREDNIDFDGEDDEEGEEREVPIITALLEKTTLKQKFI